MAASRGILINYLFRTISRTTLRNFTYVRTQIPDNNVLDTHKLKGLMLPSLRLLVTSSVRWDGVSQMEQDDLREKEEASEAELLQGMEYLQSEDYMERYGNKPVWANYKRNHKGRIPPLKTRKTCIRGSGEKKRVCGNPCPICRDEKLLIHYKNPKLLEQFICPHSWNIYSTYRTGVCQRQYKKLCATIEKARQHGLLEYSVPFTKYNYDDYLSDDVGTGEREEKSAR